MYTSRPRVLRFSEFIEFTSRTAAGCVTDHAWKNFSPNSILLCHDECSSGLRSFDQNSPQSAIAEDMNCFPCSVLVDHPDLRVAYVRQPDSSAGSAHRHVRRLCESISSFRMNPESEWPRTSSRSLGPDRFGPHSRRPATGGCSRRGVCSVCPDRRRPTCTGRPAGRSFTRLPGIDLDRVQKHSATAP